MAPARGKTTVSPAEVSPELLALLQVMTSAIETSTTTMSQQMYENTQAISRVIAHLDGASPASATSPTTTSIVCDTVGAGPVREIDANDVARDVEKQEQQNLVSGSYLLAASQSVAVPVLSVPQSVPPAMKLLTPMNRKPRPAHAHTDGGAAFNAGSSSDSRTKPAPSDSRTETAPLPDTKLLQSQPVVSLSDASVPGRPPDSGRMPDTKLLQSQPVVSLSEPSAPECPPNPVRLSDVDRPSV